MTTTETTLHAVRSVSLSAADAVAWFAAGVPAVGYTMSARAATWLRIRSDGTVEQHRGGGFDDAYELVLFDGNRELRWLRGHDGRGPAVAVGEDPALLPAGLDVTATPPPRRGDTQTRLLAGAPRAHPAPGWTTLTSGRYATTDLPLTFSGGDVIVIDAVEYLTEDVHGNRDVADTRTVGLRAIPQDAIPTPTGIPDSPERSTA
ncbi:CRISPR-associated protein Csx19 [Dactylosporangium sp. NPDC005555]|uniref:type III-D CRISPR-associated protein Csx19 n=1 Tax=Dactylosporangium sp. NPDC005555 TaxID=3154889 RepID=UPI0033BBF478